jgi:Family of unknown function (DUF6527)
MMRHTHLEHRFIEYIPECLEAGVLYISIEYATAVHRCCCGCGQEVVTPFTPIDWSLIFDGETVSLHPSIGNWSLSCRSHYFIRRGQVIEASTWSDEQIEDNRRKDRTGKESYYVKPTSINTIKTAPDITPQEREINLSLRKWILDLVQKMTSWLK